MRAELSSVGGIWVGREEGARIMGGRPFGAITPPPDQKPWSTKSCYMLRRLHLPRSPANLYASLQVPLTAITTLKRALTTYDHAPTARPRLRNQKSVSEQQSLLLSYTLNASHHVMRLPRFQETRRPGDRCRDRALADHRLLLLPSEPRKLHPS